MIKSQLNEPDWKIEYEQLNQDTDEILSDTITMYADENEDFESIAHWIEEQGQVISLRIDYIGK